LVAVMSRSGLTVLRGSHKFNFRTCGLGGLKPAVAVGLTSGGLRTT
jgi:hypothetical protein